MGTKQGIKWWNSSRYRDGQKVRIHFLQSKSKLLKLIDHSTPPSCLSEVGNIRPLRIFSISFVRSTQPCHSRVLKPLASRSSAIAYVQATSDRNVSVHYNVHSEDTNHIQRTTEKDYNLWTDNVQGFRVYFMNQQHYICSVSSRYFLLTGLQSSPILDFETNIVPETKYIHTIS